MFNGPRPAEAVDRLRTLEAEGALIVGGNTDIAVTDYDYTAAFPWMEDVPSQLSRCGRMGARTAFRRTA